MIGRNHIFQNTNITPSTYRTRQLADIFRDGFSVHTNDAQCRYSFCLAHEDQISVGILKSLRNYDLAQVICKKMNIDLDGEIPLKNIRAELATYALMSLRENLLHKGLNNKTSTDGYLTRPLSSEAYYRLVNTISKEIKSIDPNISNLNSLRKWEIADDLCKIGHNVAKQEFKVCYMASSSEVSPPHREFHWS